MTKLPHILSGGVRTRRSGVAWVQYWKRSDHFDPGRSRTGRHQIILAQWVSSTGRLQIILIRDIPVLEEFRSYGCRELWLQEQGEALTILQTTFDELTLRCGKIEHAFCLSLISKGAPHGL